MGGSGKKGRNSSSPSPASIANKKQLLKSGSKSQVSNASSCSYDKEDEWAVNAATKSKAERLNIQSSGMVQVLNVAKGTSPSAYAKDTKTTISKTISQECPEQELELYEDLDADLSSKKEYEGGKAVVSTPLRAPQDPISQGHTEEEFEPSDDCEANEFGDSQEEGAFRSLLDSNELLKRKKSNGLAKVEADYKASLTRIAALEDEICKFKMDVNHSNSVKLSQVNSEARHISSAMAGIVLDHNQSTKLKRKGDTSTVFDSKSSDCPESNELVESVSQGPFVTNGYIGLHNNSECVECVDKVHMSSQPFSLKSGDMLPFIDGIPPIGPLFKAAGTCADYSKAEKEAFIFGALSPNYSIQTSSFAKERDPMAFPSTCSSGIGLRTEVGQVGHKLDAHNLSPINEGDAIVGEEPHTVNDIGPPSVNLISRPVNELNQQPRPTTWAALVRKPESKPFQLSYIKPKEGSVSSVIRMPKNLAEEGSRVWSNTLVGYFIGKKLPYTLVKNTSSRLWNKHGLKDMLATDSGYFFFSFESREESAKILEGGPWYFAGQPILLKNWHTGLSLSKEAPPSIPVWVHIFNIPLEYWNPEGLSHIASALGKPLHVDNLTASCRRISYARICVEVSAAQDFQKSLVLEAEDPSNGEVDKIHLKVEYQWTPLRCAKCKKFGHDCARLPNVQKNPKSTSRPSSPIHRHVEEGAWMVKSKGKTVLDPSQKDNQPASDEGIPDFHNEAVHTENEFGTSMASRLNKDSQYMVPSSSSPPSPPQHPSKEAVTDSLYINSKTHTESGSILSKIEGQKYKG